MMHDVLLKVKEIGEIKAFFVKSTANSIYLRDAMIDKSLNTVVSEMKISKKFIISFKVVEIPSFESFTDAQLKIILSQDNKTYSAMAQKILDQRQSTPASTPENKTYSKKPVQVYEGFNGNETQSTLVKDNEELKKSSDKKIQDPKRNQKLKQWNQIKANEELFGIKSDFDINEYAEPIDRNAENYSQIHEKSVKIANEINEKIANENSTRKGNSDEKMYSAVDKTNVWENSKPRREGGKAFQNTTVDEPAAPQAVVDPVVLQHNKELAEKAENVMKSVGGNGEDMWSSIATYLSAKKKVENVCNGIRSVPSSQPASENNTGDNSPVGESRYGSKSPNNSSRSDNKYERGPRSSSRGGNYDREGKSGSRERGENRDFNGRQHRSGLNKKGDHQATGNKAVKQIKLASETRFKTSAEFDNHVKSSFKSSKGRTSSTTWGNGAKLEASLSEKRKLSIHLLPTENRIKEIESNAKCVTYSKARL